MKIEYAWKNSVHTFNIAKADAQKVGEEIEKSNFNVDEMLDYAKNEDSELHKLFEWNNDIAAEKYRRLQAREIIRSIVIKGTENTDTPIRSFQITTKPNTYAPVHTFLTNKNEYESLLSRAISELKAIENRYKQLSELEEVFMAIDSL